MSNVGVPSPTEAPTLSRRELNKAATRKAIAGAALAQLRDKGPGNFTVEDIAAAAGISRRTFFNYFSSLEAALASVTDSFLESALDEFRKRPADEPVLESARAALMALADPMAVAPMAELFSLTHNDRTLARSELEAWEHCTTQISNAVRGRFGNGIGDLYVRALAGAVISCGKAAMTVWFEHRGPDFSPESLDELRRHLIDAMGLLGSGFSTVDLPTPSKERH